MAGIFLILPAIVLVAVYFAGKNYPYIGREEIRRAQTVANSLALASIMWLSSSDPESAARAFGLSETGAMLFYALPFLVWLWLSFTILTLRHVDLARLLTAYPEEK